MSQKIIIFTDSTCDLNQEEIDKYNIKVLPLYVNFGSDSYKDNVDITVDELYDKVKECGNTPKTAAISVYDFIEAFEPYVKEKYHIIYTGISSCMSSTYKNANLAAQELNSEDLIHVVDSMNLSTGIGLIVLKAAKMVENGMDVLSIIEEMKRIVPLVRSQFAIETFDYLYKGGRCSAMSKLFGSMLKIKPIISVRDGKMDVMKKPHGHMKKALDELLNIIYKDKDNLDGDVVMITHSKALEYESYLRKELEKNITTKTIMTTSAGCVISSHCGKGTIGILYILKK